MSRQKYLLLYVAAGILFAPQFALAYVGPGTGLSAIGSFFALLMTLVLVIVGFFWLPLKRVLKSIRKNPETQPEEPAHDDSSVQMTEHIEKSETSAKN